MKLENFLDYFDDVNMRVEIIGLNSNIGEGQVYNIFEDGNIYKKAISQEVLDMEVNSIDAIKEQMKILIWVEDYFAI